MDMAVASLSADVSNLTAATATVTPAEPTMNSRLSSLLLLGSYALQAVFGLPSPDAIRTTQRDLLRRSVDTFVATESPIALTRLLCNIGSTGCYAAGASSGVVLASPSKNSP